MKVLLTGGTGAMGRPTVTRLVESGHQVRAVARNEPKAEALRNLGAEAVVADVFDPDAVEKAVRGVDAVLHIATNVPPMSKMALPGAWKTHNRLRTEATRLLLDAARTQDVGTFVKESITFTYPDRGDAWIDESVPPDDSVKMLRPTLEGEHQVARFGADGGRGVLLRFGLFYGPENRANDEYLKLARLRMAPVPGDADGYVSSIHMEDAATAVVAALEAASGVYNVVDDEPLTRREYADAFAAAFDLPHLRIVPAGVIRVMWLGRASGHRVAARLERSLQGIDGLGAYIPKRARGMGGHWLSTKEGHRMTPRTITKTALGITAAVGFLTSLWILVAPRSFYDDFPGLGNPWISPDGPYNEHLLRDYGAGMLGLSVLAACAFAWLSRRLAIATGLAWLAASVPHLAYHFFHLDPYETGDQVGIIASLTVGPILALVIVIAGMRLAPEPAGGGYN